MDQTKGSGDHLKRDSRLSRHTIACRVGLRKAAVAAGKHETCCAPSDTRIRQGVKKCGLRMMA
jgi:hypothetical protein